MNCIAGELAGVTVSEPGDQPIVVKWRSSRSNLMEMLVFYSTYHIFSNLSEALSFWDCKNRRKTVSWPKAKPTEAAPIRSNSNISGA
eukprot:scaffold22642_cov134-Cylindrotheca_fusiformis.AAC.3